jgi:hypothetical protein
MPTEDRARDIRQLMPGITPGMMMIIKLMGDYNPVYPPISFSRASRRSPFGSSCPWRTGHATSCGSSHAPGQARGRYRRDPRIGLPQATTPRTSSLWQRHTISSSSSSITIMIIIIVVVVIVVLIIIITIITIIIIIIIIIIIMSTTRHTGARGRVAHEGTVQAHGAEPLGRRLAEVRRRQLVICTWAHGETI